MPGEFIIAMLLCRIIIAMYQLLKGVPFLRMIFFYCFKRNLIRNQLFLFKVFFDSEVVFCLLFLFKSNCKKKEPGMMPGEFIIATLLCRIIIAMYQLLKGVPFLRMIFFTVLKGI